MILKSSTKCQEKERKEKTLLPPFPIHLSKPKKRNSMNQSSISMNIILPTSPILFPKSRKSKGEWYIHFCIFSAPFPSFEDYRGRHSDIDP